MYVIVIDLTGLEVACVIQEIYGFGLFLFKVWCLQVWMYSIYCQSRYDTHVLHDGSILQYKTQIRTLVEYGPGRVIAPS